MSFNWPLNQVQEFQYGLLSNKCNVVCGGLEISTPEQHTFQESRSSQINFGDWGASWQDSIDCLILIELISHKNLSGIAFET
jgi:hypothetical protein